MLPLICTALMARGHEVTVASTNDGGREVRQVPLQKVLVERGVPTIFFSRSFPFYTYSPSLARWVRLTVQDFDLVHAHALFSFPPVAATRIARQRRTPYVLRPLGTLSEWGRTNRHPYLKSLSLRLFELRLLREAGAVHVTSLAEAEEVAAVCPDARTEIIPNPVQIDPEQQSGSATHKKSANRILFLSRIDEKKGLDLLLRALARVVEQVPAARLTIAGDGEPRYIAQLKALAHEIGVDEAIDWVGYVEGHAKRTAFEEADVFVLPSRSENFGIAVAEAMGARLPVVVSGAVGLKADVAESSAGIVSETDPRSLSDAITDLLTHPDKATGMGARGHAFVKASLSPEVIASQLENLYTELVTS